MGDRGIVVPQGWGRRLEGWDGECKGRLKGWGFRGADTFTDEVKVAEGNGQRLGWVAEEDFGSEAVADCVKEDGIGRGAKGAGDIRGEGRVFEVRDGRDGGVDGEGRDKWGREVYVGRVIK